MTFEQVIRQHGGRLFTLGMRFCGSRSDAEDLVQEVFLNAWRGWSGFQGRSDVKTWLYTIAARTCRRMQRRRAGQPRRIASLNALPPFDEAYIADVPGDGRGGGAGSPDPAFEAVRHEAREAVEAAIVALPEHYRISLVLREIVGFTVEEVAGVLGLLPETVRSRVHRGRMLLRAAVDRTLPRRQRPADPPAYPLQVCLDLLRAKQEALDRDAPFRDEVLCERCRTVFATLDLSHDACRDLGRGEIPPELLERLLSIPAGNNFGNARRKSVSKK